MKICVSAEEPELHSLIAEEFGHSNFFVIYDTTNGNWEAFPNKATEAGVGAGIVAAEQVIDLGAEVVLTGFVGPHGEKKLQSADVRIVMDEDGTVWSSIQRYIKKHPECAPAPTPAIPAPPE
jgi:predicted Fe-Mo cluster-binding NifX family protein